MGLFQQLKLLFADERLSGESRRAYVEAKDVPSLLERLGENVTRNEVVLRQVRAGLSKLELTERATVSSIKRGNIAGRGVRLALHAVNRYRKQLDHLVEKADIINKNLNLNINLIGKIEAMQAIEMRGLDADLIDQVIMDFTEKLERYQHGLVGAEAIVGAEQSTLNESERRELEDLEREILGSVEHFNKRLAPREVERDDDGDFEPLSTERDIERALEAGERVVRDIQAPPEREKELDA